MSGRQRLVFAGIAVLIAAVAAVVLAGGGDEAEDPATIATATATATATAEVTQTPTAEPTPEAAEIVVEGGKVEGGEAEIRVEQGETVRFTVRSDKPDHVHVHGYDVKKDVGPDTVARFSFKADITGVFEVELEESHLPIASLRVDQ